MVLVDANVLLDILTSDPEWEGKSLTALENGLAEGLAINPIIYAELSPGYRSESELERALEGMPLQRLNVPYEAGFLAGHAFLQYRRNGGQRRSPLPDFYIGAHAQVMNLSLLTRDEGRYKTYFPELRLVLP